MVNASDALANASDALANASHGPATGRPCPASPREAKTSPHPPRETAAGGPTTDALYLPGEVERFTREASFGAVRLVDGRSLTFDAGACLSYLGRERFLPEASRRNSG